MLIYHGGLVTWKYANVVSLIDVARFDSLLRAVLFKRVVGRIGILRKESRKRGNIFIKYKVDSNEGMG